MQRSPSPAHKVWGKRQAVNATDPATATDLPLSSSSSALLPDASSSSAVSSDSTLPVDSASTTPLASESSASTSATSAPVEETSSPSLGAPSESSSPSTTSVSASSTLDEDLDPSPYYSGSSTSTILETAAVSTIFSGGAAVETVYSTRILTGSASSSATAAPVSGGMSSGARSGAIAGGVVGGVALFALAALLFLRSRKSRSSDDGIRWPEIDRSAVLYPEQTKPTGRRGFGGDDDEDGEGMEEVGGGGVMRGAPGAGGSGASALGAGAGATALGASAAGRSSYYSSEGHHSSQLDSPSASNGPHSLGHSQSLSRFGAPVLPPISSLSQEGHSLGISSSEGHQDVGWRTPSPSNETHEEGTMRSGSPTPMAVGGEGQREWRLRVVNTDE